jgi:perosamine synthetase
MQIPFAKPYLTGVEGELVADVIRSGWISQGPKVREFEAAFAARVGAVDAVATTSCTTALQLALYAAGVGPGDEVVVPSLSFIASANAVWQCGATPVFADVNPLTYNLDPESAERAITARTRAIMPVHQIGLPADMDEFAELATRHDLTIVEDAACAIGATYKGRLIGSISPFACFSFHPRKVITTGEGGMITVDDQGVADRLRKLRAHGMSVSDLDRHNANSVVVESYPERGWNYRMTDMQAALGLSQLTVLDEILERRARLAERYNSELADVAALELPFEPADRVRTWQSYCLRLTPDSPVDRDEFMSLLLADGIPTRRGVMASHEEACYSEGAPSLPHTEAAARETVMLPLFTDMSEEQQDHVLAAVRGHLGAESREGAVRSMLGS